MAHLFVPIDIVILVIFSKSEFCVNIMAAYKIYLKYLNTKLIYAQIR
jgi:hypothetical protein